jgi:AcrR family transcriptional regulator
MRADARLNREKILAAADAVFAEQGPGASTEEVARRAGVAIGTVFRHFPAKTDLLAALMKRLLEQVAADAAELAASPRPDTALFEFFTRLVERAAADRAVVNLLGVEVGAPLGTLGDQVQRLVTRGQEAGAVRGDVRLDEVMALLVAACQGALAGGWDADLRRRALAILFDGLKAD